MQRPRRLSALLTSSSPLRSETTRKLGGKPRLFFTLLMTSYLSSSASFVTATPSDPEATLASSAPSPETPTTKHLPPSSSLSMDPVMCALP
nr:uncharacterized protein CTRU02_04958 [Colletotrichum truncatum]KAF6794756.1 hypothetical protein CTRU02_04958 [Colletotrichum truncatum]